MDDKGQAVRNDNLDHGDTMTTDNLYKVYSKVQIECISQRYKIIYDIWLSNIVQKFKHRLYYTVLQLIYYEYRG